MREVVTEATRKRGVYFKFFTVVVVICILCSQLFVVWKIQDKYRKGGAAAKGKEGDSAASLYKSVQKTTKALKSKEDKDGLPSSISQVLKRLPEPKLDEFAFESDVVEAQQDMVEKFPAHPGLVINKLNKVIEKEEKRSESIATEIEKVREEFGLDATTARSGIGRRLSAVQYEPGLPPCPQTSPHLLGPLVVKSELTERERNLAPRSDEWRRWYGPLKTGGSYSPDDCRPRQKVAIIVPFRDRKEHLQLFLRHMHPILQRQQLDYRIFVVEQAGEEAFNRAALMNVGYAEASQKGAFDCFVFHDVDLVPEDDRSVYSCPKDTPKHLAVAVNKWKYRLIYGNYFGGVTALTKEQFEDINGFSNSFYGWGGEDDDLFHRVTKKGYAVFRYPGNIGRYSMLKHDKVDMNEDLDSMMEMSKKDMLTDDGLTTLQYKKLNEKLLPTHTWVLVKLPPPPPKKQPSPWDAVKSQLWSGMEKVGGGVALSISDHANHVAMRKQREREQSVDHLY